MSVWRRGIAILCHIAVLREKARRFAQRPERHLKQESAAEAGFEGGPNRVLRELRSPRDEIAAPARLNADTLVADGWRLVAQYEGATDTGRCRLRSERSCTHPFPSDRGSGGGLAESGS